MASLVINRLPSVSRLRRILRPLLNCGAGALLCLLTACATAYVPVGDWARPSQIPLSSDSLTGIKIAVRCARQLGNGDLRERSLQICSQIENVLSELGATILDDEDHDAPNSGTATAAAPAADLTVWYVDKGLGEAQQSGYSWAAYLFTAYIVPVVSAQASDAELRLLDRRGVILERSGLEVQRVSLFGWAALAGLLGRPEKQRRLDLGALFSRFVKNQVASQALRLRLAQGQEPK